MSARRCTQRTRAPNPTRQAGGFTLIEILVTMLILVLGLLGVIGMQTRASTTEFESYQRGQALSLARDMQARLLSSRGALAGYLNTSVSSAKGTVYFGNGAGAANFTDAGGNCIAPAGDALSQAKYQACTWGIDLQGVAAKDASGAVGSMLGARGCIIQLNPPQQNALADLYVVVVWQGVGKGTEPFDDSPAGKNNCASDANFDAGLRRGVSVRVLVPDLQKS